MVAPATLDLRTGPTGDEIVLDGVDGGMAWAVLLPTLVGMGSLAAAATLLPSGLGVGLLVLTLLVLAGVGVFVLGRRARLRRLRVTAEGIVLVDGREVVRIPWVDLAPVQVEGGRVLLCVGVPGSPRACHALGEGLDDTDRDWLAGWLEDRRRKARQAARQAR